MIEVRVPASSANLGSGFDFLGVALGTYDVLQLDFAKGESQVEVFGEGMHSVPKDESNLVMRSIQQGLSAWDVPMPSVLLRCHNAIPHGRGLGSSAAAIVGGLALAWGIAFPGRELDRKELLRLATVAEGHIDNAAAAIFGGALLGWSESDNIEVQPIELHPELLFKVYVPSFKAATAKARGLLPNMVPLVDAVVQASRAALLIEALTLNPDHLLVATEDRLHQDYRQSIMQSSYELMHQLRDCGVPATISGAGPSVLALGTAEQLSAADELFAKIQYNIATEFQLRNLQIGTGVSLTL